MGLRRTALQVRATVAIVVALLALAACGGATQERQLLRRFFEASRLYDRTALAALGAATFNPASDGIVRDFEIISVGTAQQADGRLSKEVTVSAQVHAPGGADSTRLLVVTLEKSGDGWTIAAIKPLPASRTWHAASSAPLT